VTGAKHPKVTTVERGQLRLIQPLDDREDRCIDEAYVSIGITVADLTNANIVLWQRVLYLVSAISNVFEQRD
jgi:hypothetical protein